MHDAPVGEALPVAVDDAGEEQPGDEEEVGHAERPGEIGDRLHPGGLAGGVLDAVSRVHQHDHDDAEALGVVDPVDAVRAAVDLCSH